MNEIKKCPNCDIELEINYTSDWDERGRVFRPTLKCEICSYGWFVNWKAD
ncbi:hypothetical protein [Virgibacillus sp. Bac332]|nr:hypothetical protein [Virgibacillus sp. Bac332]